MPATDAIPMQAVDVRASSSDWVMICPVHGTVKMAVQFNGDWGRTYCQDCFEDALAGLAAKVVVTAKPGAPDPESSE